MNFTIVLKNSKYCDGCPLFYPRGMDGPTGCYLDYGNMDQTYDRITELPVRPQQCIDDNGE